MSIAESVRLSQALERIEALEKRVAELERGPKEDDEMWAAHFAEMKERAERHEGEIKAMKMRMGKK